MIICDGGCVDLTHDILHRIKDVAALGGFAHPLPSNISGGSICIDDTGRALALRTGDSRSSRLHQWWSTPKDNGGVSTHKSAAGLHRQRLKGVCANESRRCLSPPPPLDGPQSFLYGGGPHLRRHYASRETDGRHHGAAADGAAGSASASRDRRRRHPSRAGKIESWGHRSSVEDSWPGRESNPRPPSRRSARRCVAARCRVGTVSALATELPGQVPSLARRRWAAVPLIDSGRASQCRGISQC